jgi:methionyl aminopeptidase
LLYEERAQVISIKLVDEISKMREACAVAARILSAISEEADVGVNTDELDCFRRDLVMKLGAKNAYFQYSVSIGPYPA